MKRRPRLRPELFALARAQRERRFQIVPGVGPERDQRFGVQDAADLADLLRDHIGQLVVGLGANHGREVVPPRDRIHLGHSGDFSEPLRHGMDLITLHVEQDDGCYLNQEPPMLNRLLRQGKR